MAERIRAFLRRVEPWQTVVACLFLLAVVLSFVAIGAVGAWLSVRSVEEELAQQPAPEAEIGIPQASQNPPTLLVPESLEDRPEEQRPEISGLAVMDVVGYLKYGPGGDAFVCSGPISGQGETTVWECRSAPGGGPPVYEVRVTGDGPLSVFYVEATIYGASEEQAANFLGYVGSLSFEEPEPVNVRAWVEGNIPSGGQLAAGDGELTLYGTTEVRTLVVAGVPQAVPVEDVTVTAPEEIPSITIPDELDPDEFGFEENDETN